MQLHLIVREGDSVGKAIAYRNICDSRNSHQIEDLITEEQGKSSSLAQMNWRGEGRYSAF